MSEKQIDSHSQQSSHDDHAHGGLGIYIAVFVALCVLTTLSFLTYFDFWDQRVPDGISRTFMMAVSCTKAMLVVMFFMHLVWEANWKYILTIPAAMMSMFLVLMLVPDVGRRVHGYSQDRWTHAAEPHVTMDHAAGEGAHAPDHQPSGGDSSH